MPSGIVMQSGSTRGADTDEQRQEALAKVFEAHGQEVDQPEAAAAEVIEAPKRDDFKTDAEFEAAEEAHEAKLEEQEEAEAEKEAEEERKRLEALPHKTRKQRAIEKATKEVNESCAKRKKRWPRSKARAVMESRSPPQQARPS
jgi:hypothetical protein